MSPLVFIYTLGVASIFFSDRQVLNVYKAYLKYEPVLNLFLPDSRLRGGSAYEYCQDNREWVSQLLPDCKVGDDEELFEAIDQCRSADKLWEWLCPDKYSRYVKLNIRGVHSDVQSKTFEFRQFPGETVDVRRIAAWVCIVARLVTYAAEASEIEAMCSKATLGNRIRDFERLVLASQSDDDAIVREMIWQTRAARVHADIHSLGCLGRCVSQ